MLCFSVIGMTLWSTSTFSNIPNHQLKWCCSSHGQNPVWSSMLQNMLPRPSSLTIWSIFWHWRWLSGLDDEVWNSCATAVVGLMDVGKRVLQLVGWLSMTVGVLDIPSFTSELFSLLLLHEPSVSLLRLMDSVGSLPFSANICTRKLTLAVKDEVYMHVVAQTTK